MFTNKKRALGLAALIGGMVAAPAANAAQDTAAATATIVVPITITKTADLKFGKLNANTGGTVAVAAATGARTVATGTVVLMNTGNTNQAASFTVGGEANATYTITLPANGTITIDDGATHTMAVDSFTTNGTGTLSGLGAETIKVGATLTVGNAQTPGSYSGNFDVVVEYN